MKLTVGSRKVLIVMTAFAMSFTLALLGKLTGEFVTVVTVGMGAFTAANAVEWARKNRNDG